MNKGIALLICALAVLFPVSPAHTQQGPQFSGEIPRPDLKAKEKPSSLDLFAWKAYRPSWGPLPLFRSDNSAVGSLIKLTKSVKTIERAKSAFLLGQIGDKAAVKPLRRLLKDSNPEVRMHAAIALAIFKDGSGMHEIATQFDGSQPWVKYYSVYGLWIIHSKFARSFMMERQKNQPPIVAKAIVEAVNTPFTPFPKASSSTRRIKNVKVDAESAWDSASRALIQESDWWWHAGNYNQVNRCLEAVIFLNPKDVESYSVVAWLQWSMGNDEEAIHTLDRCIANNPENPRAYFELGFHYTRTKRWAAAEGPLRKCVELKGNLQMHKSYAHCLEKLGKLDECLQVWKMLKEKYPNDPVIENNYKRVLGKIGQPA